MGERRIHKYNAPTESFLKKYSHYGHYSQAGRICPIQLRKGRSDELYAPRSDCTKVLTVRLPAKPPIKRTLEGRPNIPQFSRLSRFCFCFFLLKKDHEIDKP